NKSELEAYKGGAALKTYLDGLHSQYPDYSLNLFAHSQGNAITGEAIRQGAPFDTYILTQGAVPDSAYDINAPLWPDLTGAEAVYPTPRSQPMGYDGVYASFSGRIINFYNYYDPVLDLWIIDQELAKPDGYLTHSLGGSQPFYTYNGVNSTHYGGLISYTVTDSQESRAMVSRSLTLPVGQSEPETSHGVIQAGIDLHARYQFNDSFPDDHSAQWVRPIQSTLPYYQQVLTQILPAP